MRLTRGGEAIGDIPTHFIPPELPGFEEAGGLEGPGIDFMSKPDGDMALAAEYFKKAGYASGKYEGDEKLLMVGTSEGVAQKAAEVAKENFEKHRLQGQPAARHAGRDVHEVLQLAARQGGDLPERRLAEGLLGPPDVPGSDLQRRQHPARPATRTGPSSTTRRSTRR